MLTTPTNETIVHKSTVTSLLNTVKLTAQRVTLRYPTPAQLSLNEVVCISSSTYVYSIRRMHSSLPISYPDRYSFR